MAEQINIIHLLKSERMRRSHAASSAITGDTLLIITSTVIIIIIMWPRWRYNQPVAFMIAHNRPIATRLPTTGRSYFHLLIRPPKIKSSLLSSTIQRLFQRSSYTPHQFTQCVQLWRRSIHYYDMDGIPCLMDRRIDYHQRKCWIRLEINRSKT